MLQKVSIKHTCGRWDDHDERLLLEKEVEGISPGCPRVVMKIIYRASFASSRYSNRA
ncbi:MAG: hypothetical protein OEY99_08505 [Aigarchaeota archaeon]|nr:hypothetical protein [Aigarchaeota archaeon]